jgi:purine-binding chemotaxis protein CheW
MNVVTMRLGEELTAIPAGCLREILEPVPVTRVPNADAFAPGLINVRGVVVPLADLRVALGIGHSADTEDTRMLVLDVPVKGEDVTVAIIANKVHDVTALDIGNMEDIPNIGMRWPPEFVRGISKWQEEFVLMPDLEAIFSQMIAKGASAGLGDEVK